MLASPWKSGNAALGKLGLVGHLGPFPTLWSSSCLEPWASLSRAWSALLRRAVPFFFWTVSSLRCAVMSVLSRFTRARFWGLAMSRVESLRRLAAQLSCLATLEAAVAHDVQALLEAPPEPVSQSLPRGMPLVSRTSVPARAPALPCRRPLPVVLVAPSCPISVAPRVFPSRALPWPRQTARSLLAATPVESRSTAGASVPTATVARKTSQRRRASGSAGARQRRRDKHRRRARRATKRSMWREI